MRRVLRPSFRLVFAVALLGGSFGCAASAPSAPRPVAPTYTSALQEAVDLPDQLLAQVDWALAPIDDANGVADSLAALRGEIELEPAAFTAICRAAFAGQPLPEGALEGVAPDQRESLEAAMLRLRAVAADLKSTPKRATAAGVAIVKLTMGALMLVRKAAAEVKANPTTLVASAGDVLRLPKELRALGPKLRDRLKSAPQASMAATTKLLAAFGPETPATSDAETEDAAAVDPEYLDALLAGNDPDQDEDQDDETMVAVAVPPLEPDPFEPEPARPRRDDAVAWSPARPRTDRQDPRLMQVTGYGLTVTGVGLMVGLVGGGYARGNQARTDYTAATTPDFERDAARRYQSGRAMMISGAVVGSLVTTVGVALVVVDATRRKTRLAATPAAGPTGASLVLTGHF